MKQNQIKNKHFYGVLVQTDFGVKAIVCKTDNAPNKFDILRVAEREHELELRKRHLPVQGYCLDHKKEANRIRLVTEYNNLVKNIKMDKFEVGIVRTI